MVRSGERAHGGPREEGKDETEVADAGRDAGNEQAAERQQPRTERLHRGGLARQPPDEGAVDALRAADVIAVDVRRLHRLQHHAGEHDAAERDAKQAGGVRREDRHATLRGVGRGAHGGAGWPMCPELVRRRRERIRAAADRCARAHEPAPHETTGGRGRETLPPGPCQEQERTRGHGEEIARQLRGAGRQRRGREPSAPAAGEWAARGERPCVPINAIGGAHGGMLDKRAQRLRTRIPRNVRPACVREPRGFREAQPLLDRHARGIVKAAPRHVNHPVGNAKHHGNAGEDRG